MGALEWPKPDRPLGAGALRALLPLYGAAFLAVLAGSEAVAISSATPAAGRLTSFVALVGCLTSMWISRRRRSSVLGTLLIIVALVFAAMRAANYAPGALLYPLDVAANPDLLLAMTFAWINAAYCFALTGPGRFSFTIVPTLAVFGLVVPLNLSTEMAVDFMVYLFASIFLLGYEGALERELNAGRRLRAGHLEVAYSRLAATALVFVVVAGGSVLAAPWLVRLSPRIYSVMARRGVRLFAALNAPDYSRLDRGGFYIGKGPIRLNPAPVMRIKAARGGLWRGVVYDRYTGFGWRQSERGYQETRSRGEARDLPRAQPIVGPRQTVRQEVEALSLVGSVAVALAEPARAAPGFVGGEPVRVRVDAYGCVSFGGVLLGGSRYVVWSEVPAGEVEALRWAQVPGPEEIGRNYFELPLRTQSVVQDIARRITQGAATPFEKVEAIREYVGRNHAYTLEGSFVPMQSDAVVEFLTYDRRGACDLFASAFVVLARAAGLPARIATGYAQGEYLPREQAFLVRGTDAHAWAEVYFNEHGWLAFDPTVGASAEAPSLLSLLAIGQYWRFAAAIVRCVVLDLAALGLIILALNALIDLRALSGRARTWWQRRHRGVLGEVEAAYLSACRHVRRAGWRRAQWQTPAEFVGMVGARAGRRGRIACGLLGLATEALQRVKYGGKDLSREELDALRRRVRRIRHFVRDLPRPDA